MFLPSLNAYSFSSHSNRTMLKQSNTNENNPNPNPKPNSSSLFFPFSNSLSTQNNGLLGSHYVSQSLDSFDTLNTTEEKATRTQRKRKLHEGGNPNPNPTPRKRTGKSDRHSKIYTAQGPRDRRMRLSVHIARKFFDLQDMLGFDKASKTIEWLFYQSRAAIREVAFNHDPQMSLDSSCISNCVNGLENSINSVAINIGELEKVVQASQAKESRDKARARARERTREKIKGVDMFEENPTTFEESEFKRILDEAKYYPSQEIDMIENFMGAASSSASNSIFDFDKDFSMSAGVDSSNSLMGMFGNWDMMIHLTGSVVQEENRNSISLAQFQSTYQ